MPAYLPFVATASVCLNITQTHREQAERASDTYDHDDGDVRLGEFK